MRMIHHNYNRLITGYVHVTANERATHYIQNQHQLLEEADWPFPLPLWIAMAKKKILTKHQTTNVPVFKT